MKKPFEFTASEATRAIDTGTLTASALVDSCLERIAEREPQVEAWIWLAADAARARARDLDRGPRRGALHGVPFGIKDIIDTHDMPTGYGSPIYDGCRPAADAACVALSREAGGVLLGKTVTTEFANLHPGKTRNPHDPARTPGGSSSGSAAAVGAGMVPLAIGTQTTASTIRPASYCGVVGYRPTWGDLRCSGVREAAGSLDTLGLMARSVEDIALFRDVLLGQPATPLPAEARRPRIGFCRTSRWDTLEPSTAALLEQAARTLASAGAQVVEVVLPEPFTRVVDAHRWVSSFEFTRNFRHEIANHADRISRTLFEGRIRDGLSCSFERYLEARNFLEQCRQQLPAACGEVDLLLTAACDGEAPVGLGTTGNPYFSAIWTALHVPCLTVPVFTGPAGLPVGAQLIGHRNRDRDLLDAARWVVAALG
jgi:Asp-tRNA(Asn)/Glu-tRNA(Gln) amidotransferase A subunit family amidase